MNIVTSQGVLWDETHYVQHKNGTYRLKGVGWSQKRFEILKKEARDHAKVAVVDDENNPHLFPIVELDWVGTA